MTPAGQNNRTAPDSTPAGPPPSAGMGLLWITPGYGMSTDEQVNFDVGADALRTYLSPAGLEEYLSHGDPLAHHGPSYFILWSALSKVLTQVLDTWRIADARHLVNFLTFGLAVFCLSRLLLRVVARRFAWMTAALFAAQPLLFGHGFINQKDTPFMAFSITSSINQRPDAATRLRPAQAWLPIAQPRALYLPT